MLNVRRVRPGHNRSLASRTFLRRFSWAPFIYERDRKKRQSQSWEQVQHITSASCPQAVNDPDLLLGAAVLRQLLLLLSLVPPLRPPPLLQGGRGLLLRGRVVCQLPAAHLAVIQPALPRAVRLVLDTDMELV